MTREEAMEVYKERSSKFRNTQSIQWKMNLSVWTLLVLAINNGIEWKIWDYYWDWNMNGILGFGITIIHGLFCYYIQKSLLSDRAVTDSIITELNKSSDAGANIPVNPQRTSSKFEWQWVLLQTSFTLGLAIYFAFR